MKTMLVSLLTLMCAATLFAQTEWRGGFPGRETAWLCAHNWSDQRVPDDMDNVVIPDCSTRGNFYPVIRSKTANVQSLVIESNASLKIGNGGHLKVMGYGLPNGALFNLGALENNGTLEVIEPVMHAVNYSGEGTLIHTRSDLKPDVCEFECAIK